MPDYRPLDLTTSGNVGVRFLAKTTLPPVIGRQELQGLPFRIGAARSSPRRCLIGFHGTGGAIGPVTIPVRCRATWLVIAHALLQSDLLAGGPIGVRAAVYVFCLADGTEVRVPIRERFEINGPPVFGQGAFASVPDPKDYLQPRYQGEWGMAGFRQHEAMQGDARGEDLNVVNLLASQWGHLFTNAEDFIGRPTASADGRTIVYCSQENRQHLLGHLSLLGLKKPVMPWCSDGPGEAELGGNLETTLSHWADACHAQGGTVVIPHLPVPNAEPATLIATGRADAIEFLGQLNRWSYQHLEYYRYLNCGYRLPLVGGTDKMSSEVPVGLMRTYVQLPADEEFTYDTWCGGLRRGHTFVTSGPLLRFTVDGVGVGDELRLPRGGGSVAVEAEARCIFPIHVLPIVQAGRVVAETTEKKGTRLLRLRVQLSVDRPTWFAARCGGPKYRPRIHHDVWRRALFAHSSPVYVGVGEPWRMFEPATAQYMLTLIDGSLAHLRRHARRFTNEHQVTHHHTHRDHQQFLEQPFHEAAAAIHRRLHAARVAH